MPPFKSQVEEDSEKEAHMQKSGGQRRKPVRGNQGVKRGDCYRVTWVYRLGKSQ